MLSSNSTSSFFKSLQNNRIIAKITASAVIFGVGYLVFLDPTVFESQDIKEVVLFLLGGSTAFLFNKD
jgi:hypothetical protein